MRWNWICTPSYLSSQWQKTCSIFIKALRVKHIHTHCEYVHVDTFVHKYACVWVCVSVKMITGGNSTTSTNYTPASCIHKQCNLCPIDLSNSFNRSTLWPPSFCLPPCSPLCGTRAERGKPSKSFCTSRVPLNNESYLARREETRRCSQNTKAAIQWASQDKSV